jgi:hypothetical protein
LCEGKLRNPKTLSCFHSFCSDCIESLINAANREGRKPECPNCLNEIVLPKESEKGKEKEGPLAGLTCHPFVKRLLEESKIDANADFPNGGLCEFCDQKEASGLCSTCNQIFYDACQRGHKKQRCSLNHEFVSLDQYDPRKKSTLCPVHVGNLLEIFCMTCKANVCSLCSTTEHNKHDLVILKDWVGIQKQKIETEQNKQR